MFLEFVQTLLGEVPDQYAFIPILGAVILLIVVVAIILNVFLGVFQMFFFRN